MALGKCKECGKEVSTSAKACPHCGAPNPTIKKSETLLGSIILAVIFGAIIYSCSSSNEKEDNSSSTKESPLDHAKKVAEDTTAKALAADAEIKCKTDLQCWGDKNIVGASVYCKRSIEKLGKYSFRWVDGMMELKFSHYKWLNKEAGTLTYIGDKIEFQNGLGAYQPAVYECDFQPQDHLVLETRAEPGHL